MPYCVHCGTEVQADHKFCEGCGKPVVLPNDRAFRRAANKAERHAERVRDRQAAVRYYRQVGSRHPHIWPITGAGSALYLVCIGAAALLVYQLGARVPEFVASPFLRLGVAAAAGVAVWFVLTVIRYVMFPEVQPHRNPDMLGEKGDFWVFLIGIPLIALALVAWLSR